MLARLEKYTDNQGVELEKIVKYNKLPNSFKADSKTIAGGSNVFSKELIQSYGFYEVVIPTFDSKIQKLDNLHLEGDVYTYDVVDRTIEGTLAELKAKKVSQLKRITGDKLSETDWYVVRYADVGMEIPDNIKELRADLRDQSNILEAEINALTTKKSVVLFDINL